VSFRILNRGVALAGVALHFDDRALTAARYVLEAAQRSARFGFWTNSLCRQTWVVMRRFCLGILDARCAKEVASDRGIRLVGHSVRIFNQKHITDADPQKDPLFASAYPADINHFALRPPHLVESLVRESDSVFEALSKQTR
jgi:hypothetical protein